MARLQGTVFVKFWGNRDPPELSRLLRGKADEPTKFWGNRVPPELSRLLHGKANETTKFCGNRDPQELSRFLFGSIFPANKSNFGGSPGTNLLFVTKDLVDTAVWAQPGTTRPPDPTLPPRAHPQDYGRRTNPSNYS